MNSVPDHWRGAWMRCWPATPPAADELKWIFPSRWVRFHTLPDSRRYPEVEADYLTILERHHTLLDELTTGDAGVLVMTAAYGMRPRTRRSGAVVRATTAARHWWSFETSDGEPNWPMWCSVFVSRMDTSPRSLDPLLRLVADDIERGVIVAPDDFTWLYHPYDGGADVLLPTTSARDDLCSRHHDWLSNLPSGL